MRVFREKKHVFIKDAVLSWSLQRSDSHKNVKKKNLNVFSPSTGIVIKAGGEGSLKGPGPVLVMQATRNT